MIDIDFGRYVEQRKGANKAQAREGAAYAYAGDLKLLRTLDSMRPVRLALEATVRMWKSIPRAELLGTAIRCSSQRFPTVYRIAERCAETLHIATPAIYLSPHGPGSAHTLGTDEDSYIVLHAALADQLTENELQFVIGRECGHIQNNHVIFSTALYYLAHFANRFVKWIVTPATMALESWSRRAEITCDRAGLICNLSLEAARSALIKSVLGSPRHYEEFDVDALLAELEKHTGGSATFTRLVHDHPYLPKRVRALQLFSESAYFRNLLGATGDGLSSTECDARVGALLSQ
jgi:Zn-dependent protease with chaperone function